MCLPTCLSRLVSSYCVSGLDWKLLRAPTQADLFSGSVLNKWQPWLPGKQKEQVWSFPQIPLSTLYTLELIGCQFQHRRIVLKQLEKKFWTIAQSLIWRDLCKFLYYQYSHSSDNCSLFTFWVMQTSYLTVKCAAFIQLATPTYPEMNQDHMMHLLNIWRCSTLKPFQQVQIY